MTWNGCHILQTLLPTETMRLFALLLLSLLLLSCEGPEGMVGPAGPQGERGEKGETGETGERGEDGNANVATITFLIDPDDYSPYTGSSGAILWDEADYDVPEITTDVATNGAVIGYLGLDDTWNILPFVGTEFSFRPEAIRVTVDRIGSTSFVRFLDGLALRFVVIYPPAMGKLENVDIEDYEAVMRVLDYP